MRHYAFQIGFGFADLGLVALRLTARVFELVRHAVKRLRQLTQLIAARDRRAAAKVALRNGARAFDQRIERCGQLLRQINGRRQCGQQRQQQRQR